MNLISRLDTWLRMNRPDYYVHLLPGASEKDVQELEMTLGFTLPNSFKDFLRWKNGQDNADPFLDNYCLMPSTGIQMVWAEFRGMLDNGVIENKEWWNPWWVPFLYDYTGNYLCIDVKGSFTGKSGQIIEYWHDVNTRDILNENFSNWLETVVLAMENGIIADGEDGDYLDFIDYSNRINVGYPIRIEVAEQ